MNWILSRIGKSPLDCPQEILSRLFSSSVVDSHSSLTQYWLAAIPKDTLWLDDWVQSSFFFGGKREREKKKPKSPCENTHTHTHTHTHAHTHAEECAQVCLNHHSFKWFNRFNRLFLLNWLQTSARLKHPAFVSDRLKTGWSKSCRPETLDPSFLMHKSCFYKLDCHMQIHSHTLMFALQFWQVCFVTLLPLYYISNIEVSIALLLHYIYLITLVTRYFVDWTLRMVAVGLWGSCGHIGNKQ